MVSSPAGDAQLPMEIQSFVEGHAWAGAVLKLQKDVLDTVQAELEQLIVKPTTHASDGNLHVPSVDGKTHFHISTYRGAEAIEHAYQTKATFAFGMLYTKTSVLACLDRGTPMLVCEIGGNGSSMLMSVFFTPRQNTLRYKDYTNKYYASKPTDTDKQLLSFKEIHKRMQGRATAAIGAVTVSTPQLPGGGLPSSASLYRPFHSPQLWTRLLAGHGTLFQFNPTDPEAVAAAQQDVMDLVQLWCAWAKSDWAGPALPAHLLDECRDMTYMWSHALDLDDDSAPVEHMLGPEATKRLKESASGDASLPPSKAW